MRVEDEHRAVGVPEVLVREHTRQRRLRGGRHEAQCEASVPRSPGHTCGTAMPGVDALVVQRTSAATASACAGVGRTYSPLCAHGALMTRSHGRPGFR